MSTLSGLRSPLVLAAAAAAAAGYPALGGDVVVERPERRDPPGLGEWLRRNNRTRKTHGAFGAGEVKQTRQRLQRATGPGSYDEWKHQLAAERAAKRAAS